MTKYEWFELVKAQLKSQIKNIKVRKADHPDHTHMIDTGDIGTTKYIFVHLNDSQASVSIGQNGETEQSLYDYTPATVNYASTEIVELINAQLTPDNTV